MSAYYEQHGKKGAELPAKPGREPSVQVAELLKKGACVSCHGDNFAKPIDPFPQDRWSARRLPLCGTEVLADARNANVGRNNAIMGGIAKAVLERRTQGPGQLPGFCGR